ncbi:hypothetical protein V497_00798 [Pseudogymnoascus sp. VKM F-4516 (FW-969)]|nr:hypothetical protein V490_06586 [Pseudogymnoascus sp. VKM F-3557]KFY66683.1 hypothetical protein V497_00798 [Pseudogymnoascus sp. VKM F-4516 (FW-969)]
MPAPTDFHQENSLCGAPAPPTTDNSNIPRFERETTRIDVRHLLNPDLTPESEHGFSGMGQQGHAPITPSPQSSPTGAQYGRTPLPNAPVPPFSGSPHSSVVNFDALDVLATAASTRDRAANLPTQAPRGLKGYIETVVEEHGRPMSSAAVHRAVVALGRHGYKFQTVRKALSNKKGPCVPLGKSNKVKWALKTWGLAASRMPRKFGTGWGTKEARERREKERGPAA